MITIADGHSNSKEKSNDFYKSNNYLFTSPSSSKANNNTMLDKLDVLIMTHNYTEGMRILKIACNNDSFIVDLFSCFLLINNQIYNQFSITLLSVLSMLKKIKEIPNKNKKTKEIFLKVFSKKINDENTINFLKDDYLYKNKHQFMITYLMSLLLWNKNTKYNASINKKNFEEFIIKALKNNMCGCNRSYIHNCNDNSTSSQLLFECKVCSFYAKNTLKKFKVDDNDKGENAEEGEEKKEKEKENSSPSISCINNILSSGSIHNKKLSLNFYERGHKTNPNNTSNGNNSNNFLNGMPKFNNTKRLSLDKYKQSDSMGDDNLTNTTGNRNSKLSYSTNNMKYQNKKNSSLGYVSYISLKKNTKNKDIILYTLGKSNTKGLSNSNFNNFKNATQKNDKRLQRNYTMRSTNRSKTNNNSTKEIFNNKSVKEKKKRIFSVRASGRNHSPNKKFLEQLLSTQRANETVKKYQSLIGPFSPPKISQRDAASKEHKKEMINKISYRPISSNKMRVQTQQNFSSSKKCNDNPHLKNITNSISALNNLILEFEQRTNKIKEEISSAKVKK